ncbi:Transposase IS116/IS110/IS902 family protein [Bacteroidales bacterium Barb6XT]|nr:Transposase IS116/IS110/IS902 family protein [Bacteroidales bacterium Barb6XT]
MKKYIAGIDISAEMSDLLVCAEYTGQYIWPLCCACRDLGLDLWPENPAQIKHGSGVQRGKDDRSDAHRIAAYGFRFQDKARLYNLPQENIMSLQQLAGERDMYAADKSKYQGQLADQERFMRKKDYRQKSGRLKKLIKGLEESLSQAAEEEEIKTLIESDETLCEQHRQLCTAEGIGDKTVVKMIVVTKGFTDFTDARKFCCHAGVAPFSYSSGSSIRSQNRVSQRADRSIKTLLHMAAPVVATRCRGELHEYYERKVAEGKNKMSVLNAVRAKLVHRMFAVIRNNQDYQKNYANALA